MQNLPEAIDFSPPRHTLVLDYPDCIRSVSLDLVEALSVGQVGLFVTSNKGTGKRARWSSRRLWAGLSVFGVKYYRYV